MDNIKVRVGNADENKEAQALFKQLGYKIERFISDSFPRWVATTDKEGAYGFSLIASVNGSKELTLHQLRDLGVLSRNDVNDANYVGNICGYFYVTCEGNIYVWNDIDAWEKSKYNTMDNIKPIHSVPKQGLISGADALRALANGEDVEYSYGTEWESVTGNQILITAITGDKFKFRLKPRTIKLNIEIPAPFKPKNNQQIWVLDTQKPCGYKSIIHHIGCEHDLCWETEKQTQEVVDALRSVLNGTEQSQ